MAIMTEKNELGEPMVPLHPDRGAGGVHEERFAVDEVGLGVGGEEGGDEGELAWQIPFVDVQPGDNVARRAAGALVDGVGLAFVGL